MSHQKEQKEEELRQLKNFFNCLKLDVYNLKAQEKPDFICDILSKEIGIELVQYHPIKHNYGKCKRNENGVREEDFDDFIDEYISVIKNKNNKSYTENYDELWLIIHTSELENSHPIIEAHITSSEFNNFKFDKIFYLNNKTPICLYEKPQSINIPLLKQIPPPFFRITIK